MSDFIHSREYLKEGDIVVVECDHQCNVRVMDNSNFSSFRSGGRHTAYGGFYKNSRHASRFHTMDIGIRRLILAVAAPTFDTTSVTSSVQRS